MIKKQFYFHLISYSAEEAEEHDILAIRNLAILYCKMRLAPWRIKNIPFGDKPVVACNIDVQEIVDGRYTIALVFTMNAFLSKFCCFHIICSADRV